MYIAGFQIYTYFIVCSITSRADVRSVVLHLTKPYAFGDPEDNEVKFSNVKSKIECAAKCLQTAENCEMMTTNQEGSECSVNKCERPRAGTLYFSKVSVKNLPNISKIQNTLKK